MNDLPHRLLSIRATGRNRGLTLVEVLITIALLAVIAVLLITALRPGDDRRCRLEAERLAAYLLSASLESKMRGAPVRARFIFTKRGSARRQLSEMSVESSATRWVDDEHATLFKVRSPISLSEVETRADGLMKSGETSIMFRGLFSPGGVAVLSVDTSVYSVIVPSNGDAPFVQRGRASFKGADELRGMAQRALSNLPSDLLTDQPSPPKVPRSRSSSRPPNRASSSGRAPPRRPPAQKTQPPSPPPIDPIDDPPPPAQPASPEDEMSDDEDEDEEEEAYCGDGQLDADEECDDGDYNEDVGACTSECQTARCGDGLLREGVDPRDQGYEECDDGNLSPGDGCNAQCEQECVTDQDCQDSEEHGLWGVCDQYGTGTCKTKLPSFALTTIDRSGVIFSDPQFNIYIAGLLQEKFFNEYQISISVGEFNQSYESPLEVTTVSIAQNLKSGALGEFPSVNVYPRVGQCTAPDGASYRYCYQANAHFPLTIYVPFTSTDICGFRPWIFIITQLSLYLDPLPDLTPQVLFTGYFTPKNAQRALSEDALNELEKTVQKDAQCRRPNDAWAITLVGMLSQSLLDQPIIENPLRAPSGCPVISDIASCDQPITDQVIQSLLDEHCTRCHQGESAYAELDLSDPFKERVIAQSATTVEGTLVIPQNYRESVLHQVAQRAHGGTSELNREDLEKLEEWILSLDP